MINFLLIDFQETPGDASEHSQLINEHTKRKKCIIEQIGEVGFGFKAGSINETFAQGWLMNREFNFVGRLIERTRSGEQMLADANIPLMENRSNVEIRLLFVLS